MPHLSYVGDAEIGEGTNIGAGTIFANYDGVAQAPHDGRQAAPGPAPTTPSSRRSTIGDGAATGGGTVVRRDVPPGALAVSGGPQRNIEGWALRKRPGTAEARRGGRGRRRATRRLTRTARVGPDGRWVTIRVARRPATEETHA